MKLPKKDLAWKKAFVDADGISYDLHPGLTMRASGVHVVAHPSGGSRIIASSSAEALRVAAGFERAQRGKYPQTATRRVSQIPGDQIRGVLRIRLDNDIRRLAVKSYIALMTRFGIGSEIVSDGLRKWLVGGSCSAHEPDIRVRLGVNTKVQTERRPSHYIAVEGCAATCSVVGVLCLCDLVTLYAHVSTDYRGPDFSIVGRLDMITLREEFLAREIQGLELPPERMLRCVNGMDQVRSRERMDAMLKEHTGHLRFRLAPNWIEAKLLLGITAWADSSWRPSKRV
ncbi:hypothetical protein [Ramlibacter henchirensis]|uniref:hypothetical protein n=1 Tax=Ramlibacter henchirensis TaxID=204072 RepID=UPI001F0ED774|nr:hypothetical protein [Ramlibacter henchirensis]